MKRHATVLIVLLVEFALGRQGHFLQWRVEARGWGERETKIPSILSSCLLLGRVKHAGLARGRRDAEKSGTG